MLFWFVGFMVRKIMPDGLFKRAVMLVDEFVLLCLFIFFAYELFAYL
jgi:hypothetical protein